MAEGEWVNVTPHNCVCKLHTTKELYGPEVATILSGLYTTECHASPASIRMHGPAKASLRMYSQLKINIAGVHNYEGTCVMVWLTMNRLSQRLGTSCFPVDTKCTNIQVTAYLKFTVDLKRLQQDPLCSTALYDNTISCLRMYLVPQTKIQMSLFPNGSVVITGAPTVALAEAALNKWMPVIAKYKLEDVDPMQKRVEFVKKAKTANPSSRRQRKQNLNHFAG